MSETKFGEPWRVDMVDEDGEWCPWVFRADSEHEEIFTGVVEDRPEIDRAVACVNAFGGIDDPGKMMDAVRELCEASAEHWQYCPSGGTKRLGLAARSLGVHLGIYSPMAEGEKSE